MISPRGWPHEWPKQIRVRGWLLLNVYMQLLSLSSHPITVMHGYVLFRIKYKPIFVALWGSRGDISGCHMSVREYLPFLRTLAASPSGSSSPSLHFLDSTLKKQALRNFEMSLTTSLRYVTSQNLQFFNSNSRLIVLFMVSELRY